MEEIKNHIIKMQSTLKSNNCIVWENPRKGTSTINKIDDKIHYKRGKSPMCLKIDLIIETYLHFKGKECSTNDLKNYKLTYKNKPCHCAFFLMLMREIFGCPICGKGVRGSHFFVKL